MASFQYAVEALDVLYYCRAVMIGLTLGSTGDQPLQPSGIDPHVQNLQVADGSTRRHTRDPSEIRILIVRVVHKKIDRQVA